MGREYSDDHQLENRSRRRLKEALEGWIINDQFEDYGIDFEVRLTTEIEQGRREAIGSTAHIQLKSSHSLSGDEEVGVSLDVDLIEDQYLTSNVPTVLILYDDSRDELYWRIIEQYCWSHLDRVNEGWRDQSTVTIKIPRRSLNSSFNELENSVLSTERRIVLRQSTDLDVQEGVPKSAGTKELESIRNDLYRQFQRKSLLQAEKCLQDNKTDEALKLFTQIIHSPITDKSTLSAGLQLLSHAEFNGVEASAEKAHVLSRALPLADKYDHDKLTELVEESQSIKPYLRSQLLGSRYKNTEIDEEFTIVAIHDWIPSEKGMMLAALQQYDDGTPWDENALAIVQNDQYEALAETGPILQSSCEEGDHEFPRKNLRMDSRPAFCKKCNLSSEVLFEFTSQEPPFVCEKCDSTKSFEKFTEGFICESCRPDSNR